jgi:hypothetical protein
MARFATSNAQALFCVFVAKSVTRLGVEGAKMDLVIGALYEGFRVTWSGTLRQPIEPFEACSRCVFVIVSGFAGWFLPHL